MPDLITLKEAAEIIGTSPAYLRIMQRRKLLKTAVKQGRDWFMERSEAQNIRRERGQG